VTARRSPLRLPIALLALLLAAAGALLTTGCGKETVSVETVARAATATNNSDGFKVAIDGKIDVPQLGKELPLKGSGVIDPKRRRGRLVIDASAFTPGAPGSAKVEQVFDGLVIYMKMPLLAQQLGGREWIKLDLGKAGQQLGLSLSQSRQVGSDPRQLLDQLKGVSGEVEKVGTDTVRGTKTTHYKAEIDLRKYVDRLPEQQREAARKAVDTLVEANGGATYPIDVWIGDDQLVRRTRIAYSLKVPGQEEKSSFEVTIDFYDFGTPVDAKPPPADQVQDLSELGSKLGGSGSATGPQQ
jgi:hypothetical protein